MWVSEVNFANNGVRRSEMWGSWPASPTTLPARGGAMAQHRLSRSGTVAASTSLVLVGL